MKKVLAIIMLTACCITEMRLAAQATGESKPLMLRTVTAPFLPTNDGKDFNIYNPVINGNQIVYGDKELKINENGSLVITSGGSDLATLYFYFQTYDFLSLQKTKLKSITQKKEDKSSIFDMKVPLDKESLETLDFRESVKILDDGRISLQTNWSVPPGSESKVRESELWIELPSDIFANEKIIIDGKEYIVPEQDKWAFFEIRTPKSITVCPDKPGKTFSIELNGCGMAVGWTYRHRTYIRLKDNKKDKVLNAVIDFRKGYKPSAASNKTGGIAFKKIEALEMPDYSSSRNLINNPSFEQGFKDFIIQRGLGGRRVSPEAWDSIFIDNSQAKFGCKSLKIKTWCKHQESQPAPLNTVAPGNLSTSPVPVEKGAYTISFYAKGDSAGEQKINLWCSDIAWAGKSFYSAVEKTSQSFTLSTQWERYSFTFDVKQSMPLILNFNATSKNGTGYVWLDGLQLEQGAASTEFACRPVEGNIISSSPDNFLSPSDKINARLEILSKPEATGKVKIDIKSFFGDALYSGEFDFKCGKDGRASISLPLENILPRGINIVKTEYTLSSGEKSYDYFRITIMDFLENKHPLKNIFSIDYGDTLCFADALKTFVRWKKIGIGAKPYPHWWEKKNCDIYDSFGIDVTNAYMSWGFKENGTYYFYIPDNFKDPYAPGVVNLIKDFRLENKDGKVTDEYLTRFKAAVAQNVRQYPHIKMWAFGCEDDARYPDWAGMTASNESFAQYVKIQIAFYEAVKATNPEIKVFSGAPCNMSTASGIKIIDRLLDATKGKIKYDCIGAHIYRDKPESPDLDADADALFSVLDKHGYGNTPVVWSEGMHYGPYNIPQWGIKSSSWGAADFWFYGSLSYDMGWTEKISAAWYARSWLVALKHSDRIVTATAGSDWNNYALDLNGTPYAFQKIPNTLGRLLGDSKFIKDIRFAPYTRCYIFEDGKKRPVAAVWSYHPKVDAGIAVPPEAEISFAINEFPEIIDLMEINRKASLDNGKIRFPVSSFPLFFVGQKGQTDNFIKSFQNAQIINSNTVTLVNLSAKPFNSTEMQVTVKNMVSAEFKGKMKVSGKEIELMVPPSKEAEYILPLAAGLNDHEITEENITAQVTAGKSSFSPELNFSGFISNKTKMKITVDGNIDDWKEIPEIKFTNMKKSNPSELVKPDNFSGWFKTCWNSAGFYICVKITDDKFVHEEFKQVGDRWQNDSLQIYFDTLCDARMKETGKYDDNDYDYAVFPSHDGTKSIVYRYKSPDPQITLATQAPPDNSIAPEISSAFKLTSDGYVYEVFFPAKYILPIQLKEGACFGLGIFVNDKDENGGKVYHSLTTTPNGTGCWNNPHLWPSVLLRE